MRLRNIPEAKQIVSDSPFVLTNDEIRSGKPGRPLYLEIGMGKGAFLLEMAARYPGVSFLGVERYESVLFRAVQKMERLGDEAPDNLFFFSEDARVLPEVLEEGSVEKLFLNFSDPWPKSRHAKRRLTSSYFLKIYESFLKKGGILEFKTDNRALFDFSVEEIDAMPGWERIYTSYDLHRELKDGEENVETEYETKFSKLGTKICKLTARFEGV